MTSWQLVPGVNAGGHVTAGGYWHPGGIEGCVKCEPPTVRCRWFARCGRPASGTRAHPILGDVPICTECAQWCEQMEAL